MEKSRVNGLTHYPDGSTRCGPIIITNNNESYGLKTLENEKEITTYNQLVSSLLEDEHSARPAIAKVIREIRTNLPSKDFEHIWGTNPEKNRVRTVIIQLREKLVQVPIIVDRIPGGY